MLRNHSDLAVSAAKPKNNGLSFYYSHPSLGIVKVALDSSFVVADIPGLIEGPPMASVLVRAF